MRIFGIKIPSMYLKQKGVNFTRVKSPGGKKRPKFYIVKRGKKYQVKKFVAKSRPVYRLRPDMSKKPW